MRKAVIIIAGVFCGILLTVDPYIARTFSAYIPIYTGGRNILRLFPYEFSLIALFTILLLLAARRLFYGAIKNHGRYFFFLLFASYQTIGLHKIGTLDLSDIVVGGFMVYFLIDAAKYDKDISVGMTDILNVLFLGTLVLSAINGGIVSMLVGLLKGIKSILITFLVANLIDKERLLSFVAKSFIVITTMSAVLGILQELIFLTTGKLIVAAIPMSELKHMYETTPMGSFFRVTAFTISYKFFSILLVNNFLLIFNLLIYPTGLRAKIRTLLQISLLLTSVAIVLTFSKDAWLGCFIVTMLSVVIRWPRFAIHYFIGCVAFIVGIYLLGLTGDIAESISQEFTWSEYRVRVQLLREGLYGFLYKHPWIGNGIGGGAEYTSHFYKWPAHSMFVLTADEIGLTGLITQLSLIVYGLLRGITLCLLDLDGLEKAIVRGLFLSFLGYLILLQFEPGFLDLYLWVFLGLIQGMVYLFKPGRFVIPRQV